jgi:hypothetical protein
MDDDLKWGDHIEHGYKKIVKYVDIFYKLRRALPLECLKNFYFAFIHSHILCAIEMYGTASASHINLLQNYFEEPSSVHTFRVILKYICNFSIRIASIFCALLMITNCMM